MLSPLPRRSDWAYCFAHFTQPCQPSPIWQSGRPAHCPFRGLLGVHSRYGLHTRAVTVFRDTLSEGFSHFVTSIAAPVASGWSGCRVGFAPTGKRRLFTAHANGRRCLIWLAASIPTANTVTFRRPYGCSYSVTIRRKQCHISETADRAPWSRTRRTEPSTSRWMR